jgi:hypothetical protein
MLGEQDRPSTDPGSGATGALEVYRASMWRPLEKVGAGLIMLCFASIGVAVVLSVGFDEFDEEAGLPLWALLGFRLMVLAFVVPWACHCLVTIITMLGLMKTRITVIADGLYLRVPSKRGRLSRSRMREQFIPWDSIQAIRTWSMWHQDGYSGESAHPHYREVRHGGLQLTDGSEVVLDNTVCARLQALMTSISRHTGLPVTSKKG